MKNGKFNYTQFAGDIEEKRKAHNLSLADVAVVTGLNRSTIFRAEQMRQLKIDSVVAICNWLDKKVQNYLTV